MEDKIELIEKEDIGMIKINGNKINNVNEYSIKREHDIVELTLKIVISAKNFTTSE